MGTLITAQALSIITKWVFTSLRYTLDLVSKQFILGRRWNMHSGFQNTIKQKPSAGSFSAVETKHVLIKDRLAGGFPEPRPGAYRVASA